MILDRIFENGDFRTQDPKRQTAARVGVLNGRIVGIDEELDGVSAREYVDLAGATVIPGLHDAHYHLSLTGERLHMINLRPGEVSTLDELYQKVADRSAELPEGAWVRGSGYDQNHLGGEHPEARALDRASGGRPVVLEHVSSHMLAVSAAAFAAAGYPDLYAIPDLPGGLVVRDKTGAATGVLQEGAQELIYGFVRPISLEEVQRNIAAASKRAIAAGLTSITEPGLGDHRVVGNTPVDFHSYLSAVESGDVRLRVTAMPYSSTLHDIAGFTSAAPFGLDLGVRTGFGNDRLSVGPVKFLSDGSLIGRSAAMHHCYHGEAQNGIMRWEPAEMTESIIAAHREGWSVATHAIGDRAIDHTLDAVEEAQRRFPNNRVRHRIEHFAVATDAQITRAAQLGVVPVPQGTFISDFGDGILSALGPERARLAYRMKSLIRAGIEVPGSTDSPISDGDPFRSIHDMVNRITSGGADFGAQQEALTIQEAVRAYTYGSAYAVRQEDRKGLIKNGYLADFVALTHDIFAVSPAEIKTVQAAMTVIDGHVEYERV